MAIRDGNGHAGVALADGPEELWPVSGSEAAELLDRRSLYERERERAEAAEARAEELRWAEVRAWCEAGSWKWRWEASRRKLRGVIAATREARRAARDALALQREVGRLHGLLREAGVDAGKRSTVMALRMEVARLRKEGRALETREAEVQNLHKARIEADAELRKALRRWRRQKAMIGSLDAGEGPARQEGAGGAAADRAPGSQVGEASRVAFGAAQGEFPQLVRAAGAAAFGAAAGPAARCAGPRPHPAAGA